MALADRNDFTRLETLLTSLAASNKRVSAKERADFERLLEVLFDRISDSLGSLLISLDRAIPTATLASDSAHKIFTSFEREKSAKTNEWEDLPWPSRLLDAAGTGSKKARLLRKDLDLTEASAFAVRNVWKGLDKTRDALKSYQHNVGFYKVSLSVAPREPTTAPCAAPADAVCRVRRPGSSGHTSQHTDSLSRMRSKVSRASWHRCGTL